MENISDYTIHFSINNFLFAILKTASIVASIIIILKRPKSVGAIVLLAGSTLSLLSVLGYILSPILYTQNDTTSVMTFQIIQSYFATFAFFLFIIGFLVFAINDLKKEQFTEHD